MEDKRQIPEGGNDGDVIEEHTKAADITEEHPTAGSIKEEHLRAGDAPSCVTFVPVVADKKPFGLLARLKNPQYTSKLWRTMWISGALFTLGMSAGQHGPTLLDLQLITGADLQRASAFFTGLAVGYLIGAVLCGATFDKINSEWLLFLGTSGLGILSIVTPYCDSYIGMIAVKAGVGLTGGIIDAAGNAEHMQTWGTEGQVLMQLLHFCFALGGVISPLYSEPFLAKKDNHTDEARQLVLENFTGAAGDLSEPTNVLYAFVITGIFALLSSIPFFLMLLCYITKQRRRKNKRTVDETTSDRGRKLPKLLHLFILASLCSFYVAYACLEKTFMSFLMTFLVNEYETVTKSEAAYMTSIYWASFAVSRFLMIFISKLLSAVRLLYLCLIILVITFISFIICAWYGAISALSAFSAMAGLGMSAIFPAGFSWAESELLKVTGRVASAIFVSGSLASMGNPLLLGYLMEYVDNMWFCYFLVGETFLLCIVFLFLLIFNRYFVVPKYGTADRTSVTIL